MPLEQYGNQLHIPLGSNLHDSLRPQVKDGPWLGLSIKLWFELQKESPIDTLKKELEDKCSR